MEQKSFVICTSDYSGLGWANMLREEYHNVILGYEMSPEEDKEEEFELVGDGVVVKQNLSKLLKNREEMRDWYWIFDSNKLSDVSEILREEGFKVFGASSFMEKMEHDRDFATSLNAENGMDIPPTFEFSSLQDGLKFLDENEETAYVFKPDDCDDSSMTYVPNSEKPEAANRELYDFMSAVQWNGTYILQEKKFGIETNVEVWFFEGKPFFSFMCMENKRKLNGEYGCNVGCAHDVIFVIPMECKAVKETVGKLFPYYESIKYTGFADANVIISDKGNYYLESCQRFGYNSHPNLFMSLGMRGFGEIMADFIDGKIDNFYDNFRYGFGSSITLYTDNPKMGYPIYISEEVEKKFYPFDTYCKGNGEGIEEKTYLAGYDNSIGIITGYGYTISDSAEDVLSNAMKINYPDRSFRCDIDKSCYPNNPIKRYEALLAMKYL